MSVQGTKSLILQKVEPFRCSFQAISLWYSLEGEQKQTNAMAVAIGERQHNQVTVVLQNVLSLHTPVYFLNQQYDLTEGIHKLTRAGNRELEQCLLLFAVKSMHRLAHTELKKANGRGKSLNGNGHICMPFE